MILYHVYHREEFVGSFLQETFSTRENAEYFIQHQDENPPEEMYIRECELDPVLVPADGGIRR